MKVHQIQNIFRYKLERKKKRRRDIRRNLCLKEILAIQNYPILEHWNGANYILNFSKYLFPLLLSPPSSRVELCSAHTPFFANWRNSMTQNRSWVSLFLSFFHSIAQTIPCYLCTKEMHWNERKSKIGDVKNSTNLL